MTYDVSVAKWCTVTVMDADGKRHSVDVRADSSFDAAHLFLTTAKSQSPTIVPEPLPIPDLKTVFEISTEGKIHRVEALALQKWILKRRNELGGPRGFLFKQRRTFE